MKLDHDQIKVELEDKGFYILENSSIAEVIPHARSEYLNLFSKLKIHPPRERFTHTDLKEKPWRKLAIGSTNGLGESYAQLLQTTYFDEQSNQHPNLRKLFSFMIEMRNQLLGLALDFGSNPVRDLYWNACRVHHYPAGGGFMMAHKDTHFPQVLEKSGHPFLQIMIPLSIRGNDFVTGGGFIVEKKTKKKIFFETERSLGNVIIFNGGGVIHGVDDVDGDKIIDFQSSTGRFAAFINVYQVLP